MKASGAIKPITYLKNHTADLVREVSENGTSVIITQNGEAKAVVMGMETYDRWRKALAMLKIAALGESAIQAGRFVSQEEAFRRAEEAIRRVEKGE